MTTYRFQEVHRKILTKFKCPECGRRFQRTIGDIQTINPFNKNADGVPKTYAEIWQELGEKLAQRAPDPTCLCGATGVVVPQKKPVRKAAA